MRALQAAYAGAVVACLLIGSEAALPDTSRAFEHGVASGDFSADGADRGSIILWTRVTPSASSDDGNITVNWAVSTQRFEFDTNVVRTGSVSTSASRDWTVKVNASDLAPMRLHYYRFSTSDGKLHSPIGRFKIFPSEDAPARLQPNQVKIAVYSCSSFPSGYFNAYVAAASPPLDVDIVNHVGDYMYEDDYGRARGDITTFSEAFSVDQYRERLAGHRKDSGEQLLFRSAPVLSMWDDHETVNNPWKTGAAGHVYTPCAELDRDFWCGANITFLRRKKNAQQAYHEWMPTNQNVMNNPAEETPLWKYFRYHQLGSLARFILPETRLFARTHTDFFGPIQKEMMEEFGAETPFSAIQRIIDSKPPSNLSDTQEQRLLELRNYVDEFRSNCSKRILGEDQMDWLNASAKSHNALWTIVSQEIVMQDRYSPYYDAAIEEQRQKGNTAIADEWEEALKNLTEGIPGQTLVSDWSSGPTGTGNRPYNPKRRPDTLVKTALDESDQEGTLNAWVAGKFNITRWFDDWEGYLQERERLLEAVDGSNNPVIYGGDSHDAWAGVLHKGFLKQCSDRDRGVNHMLEYDSSQWTPVAAEFDGNSVSSGGSEGGLRLPYEFHGNATTISNPMMQYHETGNKGLMLMTINRREHIAEYIYLLRNESVQMAANPNKLDSGKEHHAAVCTRAFRVTPGNPSVEEIECQTDVANMRPAEMVVTRSSSTSIGSSSNNSGTNNGLSSSASAALLVFFCLFAVSTIVLAVFVHLLRKGNSKLQHMQLNDNTNQL